MNTIDPQQIIAQGRQQIVDELNMAHLPQDEQDEVLDKLGEVLLRRVMMKIFELLPEAEKTNFEQLVQADQQEALQALIQKNIPNAEEIIKQEIRAGVDEHKQRLNDLVSGQGASSTIGADTGDLQAAGLDVVDEGGAEIPASPAQAPMQEDFVVDASGDAKPMDAAHPPQDAPEGTAGQMAAAAGMQAPKLPEQPAY